jgi:hypothetical protein
VSLYSVLSVLSALCISGTGDVTMFSLRQGALRDWKESDEPWTGHARLYPNCLCVTFIKGKPFIQKSKRQKALEMYSFNLKHSTLSKNVNITYFLINESSSKRS